jgi:hypothetical protein
MHVCLCVCMCTDTPNPNYLLTPHQESLDLFKDIATKASGLFVAFTPYGEEALVSRPIMDVKWSDLIPGAVQLCGVVWCDVK